MFIKIFMIKYNIELHKNVYGSIRARYDAILNVTLRILSAVFITVSALLTSIFCKSIILSLGILLFTILIVFSLFAKPAKDSN